MEQYMKFFPRPPKHGTSNRELRHEDVFLRNMDIEIEIEI
jgi:hypothetical protein